MDPHPTPVPVRKLNLMRKAPESPRISAKSVPGIFREKRVLGDNSGLLGKESKPLSSETKLRTRNLPIAGAKSSSDKNTTRKYNISASFLDTKVDKIVKCSSDGSSMEPKTPVKSAAVRAKPRLTKPYLSAAKCRFDKLVTSSYWLGQIKVAESVGKHFVSLSFFGLALDCKAEAIRNIRVELKKYVGCHDYFSDEEYWVKLFFNYGLVEGENSMIKENMKEAREEEISSAHHNVEDLNSQKENPEQIKELNFHGCCSSKHSEKSSPGRQLFN